MEILKVSPTQSIDSCAFEICFEVKEIPILLTKRRLFKNHYIN